MSKVELESTASGFNLATINNNFQAIEDVLNNDVLWRDNPEGEPNAMSNDLDMNSHRVYNLPEPINLNEAARLQDVQAAIAGANAANLISFTPTGTIASATVQAAIEELDSDIQAIDAVSETNLANTSNASLGDALIGTKRTETDAQATTVHTWIQRAPIRLTDFGAVVDGVTDDTTAWTRAFAAITTAGGGVLELPPGTTCITSKLTLPEDLTIVGRGKEVSIVKVNAAVVGFERVYANHTNVNRLNLIVHNVGFTGAASALGAFKLDLVDYFDFEHCSFKGFQAAGAYGVRLVQSWRGGFRYCHFEDIDAYGVLQETSGGVGCNHTWILDSEIIGNNEVTFVGLMLRGQQINVERNDISGSGNGATGIAIEQGEGIHIHRNYIEQWNTAAIRGNSGTASQRITIEYNVIQANSSDICDFDLTGNTNIVFRRNRFADATGGQTCINFGNTTNWSTEGNDIASALAESDKQADPGYYTPFIHYSTTWDPVSLAAGASTFLEVAVADAATKDQVLVTLDNIGAQDMMLSAHVRGTGVVRVVLLNREAGAVDLGSGNLYISVLKAPQ
jgi:hypothetical protein